VLTALHLTDFRCHAEVHHRALAPRVAFIGDNGRGKTTLLEAVHVLSRVRSFRTHQNRELIRWGADRLGVAGTFSTPGLLALKVLWSPEERLLEIDGRPAATFREYWGRCHVAVFQNTDRQLVQGAAALRRQWADSLAASIDPAYLPALQSAQLLLKQKNALLRQDRPDRAVWTALTLQLRQHCAAIAAARATLTRAAQPVLEQAYRRLAGGRERLHVDHVDEITRQLQRGDDTLWERETGLRTARLGPHRDDWELLLDGHPLRQYGSEGQQKSSVLALRQVELELVRAHRGVWPIILLDDAVNELDPARQDAFWNILPREAQIFFATTRADLLPPALAFEVVAL
jgi:DNA replication and repair protein RecF